MSRVTPDAPALAVSPDGVWLAVLSKKRLHLYELGTATGGNLPQSLVELELSQESAAAQIGFLSRSQLLYVAPYEETNEDGSPKESGISAGLFVVPEMRLQSSLRIPDLSRILGIGSSGAVVAPLGPGAEVLTARHGELHLDRTFIRGDVHSAAPAPERRWLFEQRGGHELWDPVTRRTVARVTLATASRQPVMQVGFALGGRLMWTLTSGIPASLEVFRFSDRLRLFELSEPGRALRAESAPGRVVIALENSLQGVGFSDVDVAAQEVHPIHLPEGTTLLSFVVRQKISTPEILAAVSGPALEGFTLVRLPLQRLSGLKEGDDGARAKSRERSKPASPFLREAVDRGEQPELPDRRSVSPERLVSETESETAEGAEADEGRDSAEAPESPDVRDSPDSPKSHEFADSPEVRDSQEPAGTAKPPAKTEPTASEAANAALGAFPHGPHGSGRSRASTASPVPSRLFPPRSVGKTSVTGPGHWRLEVCLFASALFSRSPSAPIPAPPVLGGPAVQALFSQLALSAPALQILGVLYAASRLLGSHEKGLFPGELVTALATLHKDGVILQELEPFSPLRRLGLIVQKKRGRLALGEVAIFLLEGDGEPKSELLFSHGGGLKQRLAAGLYLAPRCATSVLRNFAGSLPQRVLRLDLLLSENPQNDLEEALLHSRLYDAVLLVDGLRGVSYPVFAADAAHAALRLSLRRLLLSARNTVPIVVCGPQLALGHLGLPAPTLRLAPPAQGQPAPSIPSAPLPAGTSFRPPRGGAMAVFPEPRPESKGSEDDFAQIGQLEPLVLGDHRAAIVLGATATPDDYGRAAYLAARDGALLSLEVPLTPPRALVLSVLLRHLPVVASALPPSEGGNFPPELLRFVP